MTPKLWTFAMLDMKLRVSHPPTRWIWYCWGWLGRGITHGHVGSIAISELLLQHWAPFTPLAQLLQPTHAVLPGLMYLLSSGWLM